jgi:hypothetical protein
VVVAVGWGKAMVMEKIVVVEGAEKAMVAVGGIEEGKD